jgi:hypothetical protein
VSAESWYCRKNLREFCRWQKYSGVSLRCFTCHLQDRVVRLFLKNNLLQLSYEIRSSWDLALRPARRQGCNFGARKRGMQTVTEHLLWHATYCNPNASAELNDFLNNIVFSEALHYRAVSTPSARAYCIHRGNANPTAISTIGTRRPDYEHSQPPPHWQAT